MDNNLYRINFRGVEITFGEDSIPRYNSFFGQHEHNSTRIKLTIDFEIISLILRFHILHIIKNK